MEKAVKIQGQNVVVVIEPDPTLADASLAADAIAALDSIQDSENSIQVCHTNKHTLKSNINIFF